MWEARAASGGTDSGLMLEKHDEVLRVIERKIFDPRPEVVPGPE